MSGNRGAMALAVLVVGACTWPACGPGGADPDPNAGNTNSNTNTNTNANAGDDGSGSGDELDRFVEFSDPDSEFATTGVRDIDGEIVRFDAAAGTLVWAAGDLAFDGWPVEGNFLGPTAFFQVRFGTENGERGAYFTETATETICDLSVPNGRLLILATTVPVPQE